MGLERIPRFFVFLAFGVFLGFLGFCHDMASQRVAQAVFGGLRFSPGLEVIGDEGGYCGSQGTELGLVLSSVSRRYKAVSRNCRPGGLLHPERIPVPPGRRHGGLKRRHHWASVWTQALKHIYLHLHGVQARHKCQALVIGENFSFGEE